MGGGRRKPPAQGFPSVEEIKGNPLPVRGKVKTRVLALDISTTCIGWALGEDKEVVRWGKLVFKTTAEIGEKLLAWNEFLTVLLDVYEPDKLLVESVLSRRANTTKRHSEMHGITRKVWRRYTGEEIKKSWFVSPKTVKSALGVRRGNDHDENKLIMVNEVNARLPHLGLRYDSGSAYTSDDDIADAVAVLLAYWTKNQKVRRRQK